MKIFAVVASIASLAGAVSDLLNETAFSPSSWIINSKDP